MALITGKKWKPGRTLRVRFLEGDKAVQQKVEHYAHQWEQYANIKFVFGNDPHAEVRIAFDPSSGSWSYIGTDILTIPAGQPTYELRLADAGDRRHGVFARGDPRVRPHAGLHPRAPEPRRRHPLEQGAGAARPDGSPNNWSADQIENNMFRRYGRTSRSSPRWIRRRS